MLNFGIGLDSAAALDKWDLSLKVSGENSPQKTASPAARCSPPPPPAQNTNTTNTMPVRHHQGRARTTREETDTDDNAVTLSVAGVDAMPAPKRITLSVSSPPAQHERGLSTSSASAAPSSAPPPLTTSTRHTPLPAGATSRTGSHQQLDLLSDAPHVSQRQPISSLSTRALTSVASAVPGVPQMRVERDTISTTPTRVTPRASRTSVTGATSMTPTGSADTTPRLIPSPSPSANSSSRYATLARPTPSRYQIFLFHGEQHVLDHQTGLVMALSAFRAGATWAPATPSSYHSFTPFETAPRYRLPCVVVASSTTTTQPGKGNAADTMRRECDEEQAIPSVAAFVAEIADKVEAQTRAFLCHP